MVREECDKYKYSIFVNTCVKTGQVNCAYYYYLFVAILFQNSLVCISLLFPFYYILHRFRVLVCKGDQPN